MSIATETLLDCEELTVRQINVSLRELDEGSKVRIIHPKGRHNMAV